MPIGQLTHEWTANIGECPFGIQEHYWPATPIVGPSKPLHITKIYAGPIHYSIDLPAYAVLSIFIAGSAVAVFILAMLIARFSRARDGTP